MPADVLEDCARRRIGSRQASNVRCEQNLRMTPEWMAFGQRLGVADIENRPRQVPRVERIEECLIVEVAPSAHIDDRGAGRKLCKEARIEDAPRGCGQGQQADQNVGLAEKRTKAGRTVVAVDSWNVPGRSTPAIQRKPEGGECSQNGFAENSEPHRTDAPRCGWNRIHWAPNARVLS